MRMSRCMASIVALVLVGATTTAVAAPVFFQTPTAKRSQANLEIGYAIDGLVGSGSNSGWGDNAGSDDNIAVFETGTDIGLAEGTLLAFTLNHQSYNNHTIGKYRISATTADRTLFADGAANNGDLGAPAIWTPLPLISAASSGGASMSVESGDTVLALGNNPSADIHTVHAMTNVAGITGIRLDALQDSRLPHDGPGRSTANGNFVLTEFSLDATDAPTVIPVGLQTATADGSQGGYLVGNLLTDNGAGWASDHGPGVGTIPQTAVFETQADVGMAGGTTLTFQLKHDAVNQHAIGKLRLSATTADRAEFADGLANGGDVGAPAIWTELAPLSVVSSGGATVKIGLDNTVLFGGTLASKDVYTVTANTSLAGITGIRLETLADPSLPDDGPGRYPTNGNYVQTYFGVDASPAGSSAVNIAQSATVTPIGASSYTSLAVINDGVTTPDTDATAAFMIPALAPQGQGFDLGGHTTVDTVRLLQRSLPSRNRLETVIVHTSAGPMTFSGLADQDLIELDLGGLDTSYVFVQPIAQHAAGNDQQIGIREIEVLTSGMGIAPWENVALGAGVTLEGPGWYEGTSPAGVTDGVVSWGPNLDNVSTAVFASSASDGSKAIVLDLGEIEVMDTLGILQQTYGGGGARQMLGDVRLEFSNDDFLTTLSTQDITLADGVAYQQVEFSPTFAQYVRVALLSQHAGSDARVGIVELQLFHLVPEPSSVLLVLIGAIGSLCLLRRQRRTTSR